MPGHRTYLPLLTGLILLAAVFASPKAVGAQPELRSVKIEGNRYFSQRKIIAWSGLKVGKPLTEENLHKAADNILRKLASEGFYFCRIDSINREINDDSTFVAVTFYLQEGERLILRDLKLSGDTTGINDDLMLLSQPEKPVFSSRLESDFWDILGAKEESGYPFARLDVKGLNLKNNSLTVEARLTSGPVAYLESVRIIGLKSTKPQVVAREARIVPGEIYRPSRLEKAWQRIRKLPYIEEVSAPALIPLGSDRYDVLFQAKEARSNSFDGVVGYQPAGDEEEGQITGLLDLSFLNLFGTGRKAKVHWERSSQYRQALELFYEEPWVAGFPINLWGEFRQEIQDSLYLQRRIAIGATWPALDVLSIKGSLFQEEVLPDSAGREYLGLYRSRARGGGVEVEYDTRDYPDNPTRGIYYRSAVAWSQKDYESSANLPDADVRHYETDANWSHPIIGRQILNLQVHGRFLTSDEEPISQPDLYRMGGTRSLRGYREDQFFGHFVGWSSVEYRLWLDKVSRIYAFFNLGYYEFDPPSGGDTEKKWPWGYGVGFRQGTRLGILGFDFALGQDDVLSTAKVHFRLINRF